MKKWIVSVLMLLSVSAFGIYSIGETVASTDNVSWNIAGPDPWTGQTGTLFDMVYSKNKPVFIFFGGTS